MTTKRLERELQTLPPASLERKLGASRRKGQRKRTNRCFGVLLKKVFHVLICRTHPLVSSSRGKGCCPRRERCFGNTPAVFFEFLFRRDDPRSSSPTRQGKRIRLNRRQLKLIFRSSVFSLTTLKMCHFSVSILERSVSFFYSG